MNKMYEKLEEVFGYTSFRPLQEEIISDISNGKDVFALMPTGAGKSLCYQLPALLKPGLTVVVSPLIALMKDQVDGLKQNGVAAEFLNSSLNQNEQRKIEQGLIECKISLLYVAPERLTQIYFLNFLKKLHVNFFAIDEAHCISEWGHDFRAEYRELKKLRQEFPQTSIAAFTATATPRVKKDIIKQLGLRELTDYKASFNRPNLHYKIYEKLKAFDKIVDYLDMHKNESGIIYCQSRNKVDKMAEKLQRYGFKAMPYHAGLSDRDRQKNQEKFINEDIHIIVATIAFGMGIDKSNVRFVIHNDIPANIERYYQETGRAGRDGLPSDCLLFYSYRDTQMIERFILEKNPDEQEIARSLLKKMVRFAETKTCRRKVLLEYFDEKFDVDNCNNCDNCVDPGETFDGTIVTQKILSCVLRLNQNFGLSYVGDVLLGKNLQKIRERGHEKLSTYGIVTDYSESQLKTYIRELVELGYLELVGDDYPVLHITSRGISFLKNKETVFLHAVVDQVKRKSVDRTSDINSDLFERLRRLRKRLADEAYIPPYLIFSDATLKDMAAMVPRTPEEFLEVKGVGNQKLEKYADDFLREIKSYITEIS